MNTDHYRRLIDLYAGGELPTELAEDVEAAAQADPALAEDLASLTATVQALRDLPRPEFTEQSQTHVEMLLHMRGVNLSPTPEPEIQYHLPI
jgi:anti-sigma factor RsiW